MSDLTISAHLVAPGVGVPDRLDVVWSGTPGVRGGVHAGERVGPAMGLLHPASGGAPQGAGARGPGASGPLLGRGVLLAGQGGER